MSEQSPRRSRNESAPQYFEGYPRGFFYHTEDTLRWGSEDLEKVVKEKNGFLGFLLHHHTFIWSHESATHNPLIQIIDKTFSNQSKLLARIQVLPPLPNSRNETSTVTITGLNRDTADTLVWYLSSFMNGSDILNILTSSSLRSPSEKWRRLYSGCVEPYVFALKRKQRTRQLASLTP